MEQENSLRNEEAAETGKKTEEEAGDERGEGKSG